MFNCALASVWHSDCKAHLQAVSSQLQLWTNGMDAICFDGGVARIS